jgi:hypothetical protein
VLRALLCWRTKDFSSGNKLPSRPTLNALGEFSNRREYKKKRSLIGFYLQPAIVKGCRMPALMRSPVKVQRSPAGRRRTSLEGGNRGMLRRSSGSPQVYGVCMCGVGLDATNLPANLTLVSHGCQPPPPYLKNF